MTNHDLHHSPDLHQSSNLTQSQDLHQRLTTLEARLAEAEAKLKSLTDGDPSHSATASDLRRRYGTLSRQVAAQEITAEAQGHHVTDLEHGLRMWLDRLDG